MNSELLLRAMEHIDERYILQAQKRLGYIVETAKPRRRSVKRIFTLALAAALALICTLAAAMAVSPEFREAVISLFQLGEVEQVPDVPEEAGEVKQITIGGEVSAQYVKVDSSWGVDSGLGLLQRLDADDGQERFYDVVNGGLVEAGVEASEISTAVSWYGRTISVHLRFFVYQDTLHLYIHLIDNLQTVCPGVECVIITNPPKVASQWLPDYTANRHFGNALIGEFVDALTQMCRENNIPYVGAYECLKNENGALPDDYCRDGYIHLNHQGAAVVVEALEAFAEGR